MTMRRPQKTVRPKRMARLSRDGSRSASLLVRRSAEKSASVRTRKTLCTWKIWRFSSDNRASSSRQWNRRGTNRLTTTSAAMTRPTIRRWISRTSGVRVMTASPKDEDTHERRDREFRLDREPRSSERAAPGPARVKVQEARTEGGEVHPVAQMLRDDCAALGREHTPDFAKERRPRVVAPQLVGR